MNGKEVLGVTGLSLLFASLAAKDRPNVIFVLADELRAHDLGYMGNRDIITPNIDYLASRSVVFTNMISGCPVSSPYRGSLLTGQYPLTNGIFVNDVMLDPSAMSLGKLFRSAGYETAWIGKWHLDGHGRSSFIPAERRHGFGYWKVLECTHDYFNSFYWDNNDKMQRWGGYDAYAQTADAANLILEKGREGKPFLLMLSWGPPHTPFSTAPENLREIYRKRMLSLRDNVPEAEKSRALAELTGYYAHITALDSCIGVLQKAVSDAGIEENTIFIFTSDHGAMVRSHGFANKQRPYEESINVPLLIRYPALLGSAGRRNDMLINTPDLMPTLLSLAGLEVPESAEGDDRSAEIRGVKKDRTEGVLLACYHPFGQYSRSQGGKEYRGIRTKRYTYVRDLSGPWMLFDNLNDPYQMKNIVNEKSYSRELARLDRQLASLLRKTNDDFLPGMEYIKKWSYLVDSTGTVPYNGINFQGVPVK